MGYRLGVDIGGTFTDIVLYKDDGWTDIAKVPSTPEDPGTAVVTGVLQILEMHGIVPGQIREIVHGTTVGSNTILQKVGAKTGLLTTAGFRDVLEIGRIRTPGMFDLSWDKPVQLSTRRYRKEVTERMSAFGEVVTPLDKTTLRNAVRELVGDGVETVAICFLNSYVNPLHEQEARDLVQAEFPELIVTASCDVLPEMKEYERTSTTVVNAYLLTQMRKYLTRLEQELACHGFDAPLLIVSSSGGMMGVKAAQERPVFAVGSGPAGGVMGAAKLAEATDLGTVIAFDMGGTTAKASLVVDNEPMLVNEYEFREGISSPSRFIKGGGYMLKVPAIDVAEVGAGGGSIAWIDNGGMLQVGPISAGARPGPAAYGLGNNRPTVTDANIALGLIGDTGLAGGSLVIDRSRAETAVKTHIAEPLGISVIEAAIGIRHLANVNMARAIRSVTVERGLDPREMTMMAFGGGGALHAADVAEILGIRRIVVPAMSGVFCSVGMLASDVEHSLVRAAVGQLSDLDGSTMVDALDDLQNRMIHRLLGDGFGPKNFDLRFEADLHYLGQSSELTVTFPRALVDDGASPLQPLFEDAYKNVYGYKDTTPVELVNLRVKGYGRRSRKLDFKTYASSQTDGESVVAAFRDVFFSLSDQWVNTMFASRRAVLNGPIEGPAILTSYDATIAVPSGAIASSDGCGSVVIDISGRLEDESK